MIHVFLRELGEFKTINKVVYYPQTRTAVIYIKKPDQIYEIMKKALEHGLHAYVQINEQKKKKMIVVRELDQVH